MYVNYTKNVTFTSLSNFLQRVICIFSSPEDNVLNVSFCDSPLTVVHRPCVRPGVNNFFKQLIL